MKIKTMLVIILIEISYIVTLYSAVNKIFELNEKVILLEQNNSEQIEEKEYYINRCEELEEMMKEKIK